MTSGHKLNGFLSTPTSDEKSRDLFTNRSGFLHHSACLCICIGCLWSPLTISVNLYIGICLHYYKTHYFPQAVLPTCNLFDLLCPKCQATNKLQNTRLCTVCICRILAPQGKIWVTALTGACNSACVCSNVPYCQWRKHFDLWKEFVLFCLVFSI